MNRRRFLGVGVGAVGAAGAVSTSGLGGATASADQAATSQALISRGGAVDRAYGALIRMMDAYQQGTTIRIIQSYSDTFGQGSTAFTYDNALAILAFLGRGKRDDVARARLLGDSFLYAQEHDPAYADGRLRQAYWVGPFSIPAGSTDAYFVRPDGTVNLVLAPWFFLGSSVGDMAWASIALAQLFARTRQGRYLDGALRLAHWIVDNAFDTTGLGGYSFGVDANNQRISHVRSAEHNIDVYALFNNLLAPLTRDSSWKDLGRHALEFIQRLWNPDGGFFWVGSNDGSTIVKDVVAEDVQSWSFLALRDQRYAAALDWAKTNLATTDTPQSLNSRLKGNLRLSGVSFSTTSRHATEPSSAFDPPPDPDAVWFEGTSQLAAALLARRWASADLPTFHGDLLTAGECLSHIELAQAELARGHLVNGIAIPDGMGVVATSGVLNSGFGFSYFPVLHVGATSWYLIAALVGNPYQL